MNGIALTVDGGWLAEKSFAAGEAAASTFLASSETTRRGVAGGCGERCGPSRICSRAVGWGRVRLQPHPLCQPYGAGRSVSRTSRFGCRPYPSGPDRRAPCVHADASPSGQARPGRFSSGRCETATSRPCWRSSSASASGRGGRASTAPKPRLSAAELAHLAAVDATRHALVAYLEGDDRPVAIARLVRDGSSAEIAFEVADEHQRLGIGSALTAELLADARAAGITEVTSLVASDNRAALELLRRLLGRLEVTFEGPELSIRAALA